VDVANRERAPLSKEEMLAEAQRQARELGGDAIIVETHLVTGGSRLEPFTVYTTGGTAYTDPMPSERLALRGQVIVWK